MKLSHILGMLRITTSTAGYYRNTSKKCLNMFNRAVDPVKHMRGAFFAKIAVLQKSVKLFSKETLLHMPMKFLLLLLLNLRISAKKSRG